MKLGFLCLYPLIALALIALGVGLLWTWRAIPLVIGGLMWLDSSIHSIIGRNHPA